jgi:3(or 17)beta-hydroxysteroid dehydrogenase
MAKGGGGSIINISSTSALCGYSIVPAYSAAKGAIVSMTRSIAVHCQEKANNVRCNVVIPGAHDTPMMPRSPDIPGSDQSNRNGLGDPVDVANVVLFLASDESRRITGTQIIVDNGETMR